MNKQELKLFVEGFTKKPVRFAELYPTEYEALVEYTSYLSGSVPIKQRFWHVMHDGSIPSCEVCGSTSIAWNKDRQDYNRCCSKKCQAQLPDVSEKKTTTLIVKYGVDHYAKTGIRSVNQTNAARRARTQQERDAASERMKQLWESKSELDKQAWAQEKKTQFFDKYGCYSILQTKEGMATHQQRMLEKYGDTSYHRSFMDASVVHALNDKQWLLTKHCDEKLTLQQIAELLDVQPSTVCDAFDRHSIEKCRYYGSGGQREIVDFVKSLGIECHENHQLDGVEVDVFIPSHNVAIEYCGIYWHCDIHPRITPSYHQRKWQHAADRDIMLLTIYDMEWHTNKQRCKDIIRQRLHVYDGIRIGARKCTIDIPPREEVKKFFNQVHIQGSPVGGTTIGLRHGDDLVACMTIKPHGSDCEISRYATIGRVQGGFTKLLKYATTHFDATTFTTFADLRYGNGKLYLDAGFTAVEMQPPTFSVYSNRTKQMLHRSNVMKHKLLAKYPDLLAPTMTEREMHNRLNILRIWDCGKIKYQKVV